MIIDRFLLERCNDSKELLMFGLIPPARYPLVFFDYQAGGDKLLARGSPLTSTAKVTALVAIVYKRKPYREYVFRKVW
jgi:hypothetical protein